MHTDVKLAPAFREERAFRFAYIRSQLPSPYTQHLCCGTAAGTAWRTAPRPRMASGLTAFGAYPRNEGVRGSSPRVGSH